MIIGHNQPEFWHSQLSPFISPDPLIPPGAEIYDWREIASVKNGITIPDDETITHPLAYEPSKPSVNSDTTSSNQTTIIPVQNQAWFRLETPLDPNNAND